MTREGIVEGRNEKGWLLDGKRSTGGQWLGVANGSIDLHIGRHDDDDGNGDDDDDNAHGPKCTHKPQGKPKRERQKEDEIVAIGKRKEERKRTFGLTN
ncbi:GL21837 [Drosophila persimilis]|uniref:GL21837 n=1 Tax=Drosophila persimilis TaxID=7234 RepID=B4GED7_DROPE|nr:GL21837 [Drosophila persimilis]